MKNTIGLALSEKSKEDGMENLSLLVIHNPYSQNKKYRKHKSYGEKKHEKKEDEEEEKEEDNEEKWKVSLRCSYKYPTNVNCEHIASFF